MKYLFKHAIEFGSAIFAAGLVSTFVACGDDSSTSGGSSCFVVDKAKTCDQMDKGDVSTWSFIRKDNFGDEMQYVYSANAEGKLQLVTTDKSCHEKLQSGYSMYDMSKESNVEMAFSAVVSTCSGK